jgi:hypothetical protein
MKKIASLFVFYLVSLGVFGQNNTLKKPDQINRELPKEESMIRKFMNDASRTRINKDWSLVAEFRSGTNEYVQFFPVQAINLLTNETVNALQIDMLIKPLQTSALGASGVAISRTAWVGLEEIDDFMDFLEKSVLPNIKLRYKDKSSEFIFKSKELTFKYLVDEKRRRLTVSINNYDYNEVNNRYFEFWTEARVDNIEELLPILKSVKNKNLVF